MESLGKDAEIENALEEFSSGNRHRRKELEASVKRIEKKIMRKISEVEPGENTADIGEEQVFAVNPVRQEDQVKNLDRVEQLAALSAAYYSGKTGAKLEDFFSQRRDLLAAAVYFRDEDWQETFEGRGGYSVTQDVIFLKQVPDMKLDTRKAQPVFRPLAHLLSSANTQRTLDGLLGHELTHAFIHQRTRYQENLSGEELSKARSIDEAAAHSIENLYNHATPPTQSYQARKDISKEYLHTAMEKFQQTIEESSSQQEKMIQIRGEALKGIETLDRGGDPMEAMEPVTEGFQEAVRIFEDAERNTLAALKLYGVIDENQHELGDYSPGDFEKVMQKFDHELETGIEDGERIIGTEETSDREFQEMLKTLREGLLKLAEHAREEEKQEIIPVAEELQEVLRYVHEEDRTLGKDLHKFYFTRGKTSSTYLRGDAPHEREEDLAKVLEKFRTGILAEALELAEEIQQPLEKVFEEEEKLTELEKKFQDSEEYTETVELIRFTRDVKKLNQESLQKLRKAEKEIEEAEEKLSGDDSGIIVA
jgi:hypothetical protein